MNGLKTTLNCRRGLRQALRSLPVYALLTAGAVLFCIPLLWCISTSFKDLQSVFRVPIEWIPRPLHPSNFRDAWKILPFPIFVVNTLIVTLFAVVGQVLSASLVAYGFARFRFPGKRLFFMLLLSTMLLPGQVTMIPVFIIWQKLGLVDTFAPLIIPAYLGGGAFTVFLLRQFYLTIPRELDEAAMIDGCSYFGIWRHILLPLSRPAIITVLLFSFMGHWDEFMGPLIYLHSQEKFTVSIGLRLFQDQYGQTNLPLLMAASLLHITPVVIIFLIGQRYFIKGIVMTGLKG
jgi:multiple sugar transport system permease protein